MLGFREVAIEAVAHKLGDRRELSEGYPLPEMIYVTRPYLRALEELIPLLEEIWNNDVLTNPGRFHQRFEDELGRFLETKQVSTSFMV